MSDIFSSKEYDVEHILNMYSSRYVHMRASEIYDDNIINKFMYVIERCHIYLIGFVPDVVLEGISQNGRTLATSFNVGGLTHILNWKLPEGFNLAGDAEEGFYVLGPDGGRSFPAEDEIASRLSSIGAANFNVVYIGQSFGKDGSRHALDRLKKHETLQKIAVSGVPKGHSLHVIMIEIQPGNRMFTVLNPFARDKSNGDVRIAQGLDKLFNTSEAERITLYEASLIRYFRPEYNSKFKNSFPSTNIDVLSDCYDKDIAAIVAEINCDKLPFLLFSQTVPAAEHHIAQHDLHDTASRKVFFSS